MFEKEDGNFLVDSLADIHCTMDVIGRLVPINLSRCESDVVARVSVTVLDPQGIAAEDDRYAMAWVTVPRRALAGCETHPSNQRCSSSVEDLLGHNLDPSCGLTLNLTDLSNSIPKVNHQRLTGQCLINALTAEVDLVEANFTGLATNPDL
jgi:hypothetical protein